jgi:peptide/nickel transport system substrate-binding protein
VLRIELPDGPGAEFVLRRLNADWSPLGVQVERAGKGTRADLRLVDLVAPSGSPSWFLRQFRCGQAPICSDDADLLLEAARAAPNPLQRNAFFAQAEQRIRDLTLFMPVAAPVRWSLVARGLPGFAENRFARHTLTGLRSKAGEDQ